METIRLEEAIQNALGVIAQGPQQDGRRQLAAPVDTDEDVVLGVELEVQPGTTIGYDPGGEEQLAGGMGLALVVVKKDAGRTVELGDDDPLGAVDDEGPGLGHERHFAHVDFLFLNILDDLGTGRGIAVIDDQAQQDAQGGGVGGAAQMALAHVEGRLAETVTDVLQHRVPGVALDRENGFEGGMQPHVLALGGFQTLLQKGPVRVDLGREQEGNIQYAGALAEVLADTLFLGERIGHAALPSTCCWKSGSPGRGDGSGRMPTAYGQRSRPMVACSVVTQRKRRKAGDPRIASLPVARDARRRKNGIT